MVDVNMTFVSFLIAFICIAVVSCNIQQSHTLHNKQKYDNIRIFDNIGISQKQNGAIKHSSNSWSVEVGKRNLDLHTDKKYSSVSRPPLKDGEIIAYTPGSIAPQFSIWGLDGKLVYPSEMFLNSSIIIHVFDPSSGFLESMWTSDEGLKPIVTSEVLNSTHFIFIPKSAEIHDLYGALWMRDRIHQTMKKQNVPLSRSGSDVGLAMMRIHFSVVPLDKLGNWIPDALSQWHCVDHLCGYDQVLVQSNASQFPVVGKRLDDVQMMQKSGAVGVVVFSDKDEPIQELTCKASQCNTPLSIPATMVEYSTLYTGNNIFSISFQNTPSENFFLAVNQAGELSELGWFLYPSMDFLVWQAQWFLYRADLDRRLQTQATIISIFSEKIMHGKQGVVVNVTLPDVKELQNYSKMELDMSLSCPGTMDTECPHWDHTINLYVCCDPGSPLCGMELGRWISAFRRRIGRWTTDVSPLFPLLTSSTCVFTMKTEPWAMPWKPSLNLRFSKTRIAGDLVPVNVTVLYEPGATFDKSYNSHFKTHSFRVPNGIKKVEVFAVITGHGSDENGCGEFCVTSHHFRVNKEINNITFSNAGTPLGCADQVPHGVEPNEHGTWLYGRNGWCDGQNVSPWVIDVTDQLGPPGTDNTLSYFGWFNGTDPNPIQNPGIIILYSYLVYYKEFTV
ncbi:uncharacterized protein [Argopecten irradians]|uniref:uncharacterized protein n=1 Tax=Argopecten irradians TaxID=31199 RepID=UPI003712C190